MGFLDNLKQFAKGMVPSKEMLDPSTWTTPEDIANIADPNRAALQTDIAGFKEDPVSHYANLAKETGQGMVESFADPINMGTMTGLYVGPKARNFKNLRQFSSIAEKAPMAEIADAGATLTPAMMEAIDAYRSGKPVPDTPLGMLMRHPEAYSKYPNWLPNHPVKFGPLEGKATGQAMPKNPITGEPAHIKIDPSHLMSMDEGSILDVLMHEIQHPVSIYEGWSPGSSPRYYESVLTKAQARAPESFANMTPEQIKSMAYERYWGTKDEIRARSTASRRKMTAQEREWTGEPTAYINPRGELVQDFRNMPLESEVPVAQQTSPLEYKQGINEMLSGLNAPATIKDFITNLGFKYNGESPPHKTVEGQHWFTDPVTGGTYVVPVNTTPDEIIKYINMKRTQFGAEPFMPEDPGAANIRPLYHGSAKRFPEFSDEKMGSGEGAQAFGFGHYLTDDPKIAEQYAESSAKTRNQPTNKWLRKQTGENISPPSGEGLYPPMGWDSYVNSYENPDQIQEVILKQYQDKLEHLQTMEMRQRLAQALDDAEKVKQYGEGAQTIQNQLDRMEELKKWADDYSAGNLIRDKRPAAPGWTHVVEVNPHLPAGLDQILNLKEPMPKQNWNDMLAYLERASKNKPKAEWPHEEVTPTVSPSKANSLKQFLPDDPSKMTYENIYHLFEDTLGSDRAATEAMKEIGIHGHKYPTGTLSGIEGSPKSNYVIYDPSRIKVLKHKRLKENKGGQVD